MPEHIEQRVVLLVEDEPLVRMLGNEVLTEAGFRVIEAADATEALVLLEARPDILVVITDVELKGENGFSLRAPFGSDGPEWGSFYVRAGRSLVPAICRSMPYFWESAALVEQVKTMADCAAEPMIIVSDATTSTEVEGPLDNVVPLRRGG